VIPQIRYEFVFPDARSASPEGIVAWGGDLSPNRLLLAYRSGIFPWYSKNDPILWWSPDPRLILNPEDFKLRRSLKKRLKHFEIRCNTAFSEVIRYCGSVPREGQKGSWIIPEMIEAYEALHDMGHAHSIEAFFEGNLVGGLYGVQIGSCFCGESMFALQPDASKAALFWLVDTMRSIPGAFIDCQVPTDHLKSLGAVEVSREFFLQRLFENISETFEIFPSRCR